MGLLFNFLRRLGLIRNAFFILFGLLGSAQAFAQVIILPPIPVIKAPSTTTITSSVNPSLAGQPVLLTATVTSSAQGTPTGTVHFYDNATNTDLTPAGVTISNGKATFTTAVLTVNASFTATYSGDGANLPSTSVAFAQTVTLIILIDGTFNQTTTTLVSNTNPSVGGSQPVTFTATVSSGNVNVTGIVDFWDNTNNQNLTPGGIPVIDGIATFTTSSLPFGDWNITAIYRGDADNQPSTSSSLIQRVQLNITGISMNLTSSSSTNTTNWGIDVSFTATVSTGLGAPSGTLIFTDNGVILGSVPMNASGQATLTTRLLTPGNHNISAQYFSLTSNTLTHNVVPPIEPNEFGFVGAPNPSNMRMTDNGGSISAYGRPITFAVYVVGFVGHVPTGTVLFQLIGDGNSYDLGEVDLDAGGNGFFTTSILPVGTNTVRAIYYGNDIYEPSSVAHNDIVIGRAATTTRLSSNRNPSIAGQQITFIATVPFPIFHESNALAPGGDVMFNIDGVDQPPAPLTGNGVKAFLDISSLPPGNHSVKATYSGDVNYGKSTSETITQVVEPVGSAIFYFLDDAQTTPVNTVFPNSLMFNILNFNPRLVGGASVTFTAPSGGASGTFSNGTNSITVNTTLLGSVGVANSGPFTANGIAGTYIVTATIPGFGTASFTMTNRGLPVQITVGTSVAGLGFSVDGINYTASSSFNWEPGTNHTFTTTSPQNLGVGTEYIFTGWSDGNNSLSRTITVPASSTSYTAGFQCSQQWVLDKDLDNYYTGNPVTACQSPGNYYVQKANQQPGDCNDNDANINPETIWLLDVDGDGYHEKLYIVLPSCAAPQDGRNYINNSKGPDCNDNDATYNPETVWVKDADGDGYYIGEPYTGCFIIFQPGYVKKTNQQPGDCNDGNAAIHAPIQYYVDADKDGFGSTLTAMLCSVVATVGYSTNNTDCNDANAAIHTPIQYYVDADKDGFGSTLTAMLCSAVAPVGYSTNNTDCNDANAALHTPIQYYVDADKDGFGSTLTAMLCSVVAPVGYSTNNTDCNDANASVHTSIQYYVDADKDGFGSTLTAMLCSAVAPVGYSTNNTDCNDANAAVHPGRPIFTCPANRVVNLVSNCQFVVPNVTTGLASTNNCSNTSFTQSPAAGTLLNGVNNGNYNVTVTATDGNGFSSSCVVVLTARDNVQPVITYCPIVPVLCYSANGTDNIPSLTATDNCGIQSVSYVISGVTSRSGNTSNASGAFNAGISTITWTVTDVNNNTATCTTTVKVDKVDATIANAYASGISSSNGSPNTIYIGYGGSSVTLTAQVTSSLSPNTYEYKWTTGSPAGPGFAKTQSITVSPSTTTTYFVSIKDANGCAPIAQVSKQIQVEDIRCGTNKITICQFKNGSYNTACVSSSPKTINSLPAGSYLGACVQSLTTKKVVPYDNAPEKMEVNLEIKLMNNPSNTEFTLVVKGNINDAITMRVSDINGRILESRKGIVNGQTLKIGLAFTQGAYFAEFVQGGQRKVVKMIKL